MTLKRHAQQQRITKGSNTGRKGGDNGSNIHILGVSDFGDWLKGNVHEFSSF